MSSIKRIDERIHEKQREVVERRDQDAFGPNKPQSPVLAASIK
jgi:hypothetical protein